MTLLEVAGLTGGYGPVQVLHGIDLSVDAGEVVVVLGANGAGKTTTLRGLTGLISAKGKVELEGRSILGKRPEVVARLGIAHVPQGRGTLTELSVEENLRLGAYVRSDDQVDADVASWYEEFPRLGERKEQLAGSLSGGEQQMLAIARGLMSRPKLLLLDEPSMGLAPRITQELFARLGEINRASGTAMLVVEQNANLALDIASRAYVLETGRIVTQGSAQELRGNDAVRKAYLGF
ncbi:MAG: putative branched-chain amino acid transporter ATP-binding protein [Acidimicrobiales bacterium]|nr:putative branched-chain amino acid transporter ATP-binding protein [Acidimicrobiales bacterium]